MRQLETAHWSIREDDAGHLSVTPRLDRVYDVSIGSLGAHPRSISIIQIDGIRDRFIGLHAVPNKPGFFRKLIHP